MFLVSLLSAAVFQSWWKIIHVMICNDALCVVDAMMIQVPIPGSVKVNIITEVNGVIVNKRPLHRNNNNNNIIHHDDDEINPFCYTACSSSTLSKDTNFLATQVWSSGQIASLILQYNFDLLFNQHIRSICEFGCGPGLPSLTAATLFQKYTTRENNNKHQQPNVYATDIDSFALDLVKAAAIEQNLNHIIEAQLYDITTSPLETTTNNNIPDCDLYILCDIFESSYIARQAAITIHHLLLRNKYIWIFCQSDRCQKDAFINELQNLQHKQRMIDNNANNNNDPNIMTPKIQWDKITSLESSTSSITTTSSLSSFQMSSPPIDETNNNDGRNNNMMIMKKLWLCEFDESIVPYH